MKIVIAGGTGFIGTYVKTRFIALGHEVKTVSRTKGDLTWNTNDLVAGLENADMLLNLAGYTINCRHTSKNKELILNSRLDTTRILGEAIQQCSTPPRLWVNASASAIYKFNKDQPATEESETSDLQFLAQVVKKWETLFFSFNNSKTRQVALRTSVVLGNGGAFNPLYYLSRFGLGGKIGEGSQMFSWIHIEDYFRILLFVLQNETLHGHINCTSPNPISNNELMKTFRQILRVPFGIPAPVFAVKVGALILNTESSLLLDSSYLYPQKLIESGFEFKFSTINSTIINLK